MHRSVIMKRKLMMAWIFFSILGLAQIAAGDPKEIDLDFRLPAPPDKISLEYLGLEPDSSFSLGQIQTEVLILEIFSMYCPVCQREAKNINTLFDQIRQNKELGQRIKLIGIGAGNSEFEVNFFKENYGIQFPLFSDSDFTIHKKIGQVRTPFFIGLKQTKTGSHIFFTHAGEIKDHNGFLDEILSASGLEFK